MSLTINREKLPPYNETQEIPLYLKVEIFDMSCFMYIKYTYTVMSHYEYFQRGYLESEGVAHKHKTHIFASEYSRRKITCSFPRRS